MLKKKKVYHLTIDNKNRNTLNDSEINNYKTNQSYDNINFNINYDKESMKKIYVKKIKHNKF